VHVLEKQEHQENSRAGNCKPLEKQFKPKIRVTNQDHIGCRNLQHLQQHKQAKNIKRVR